MLARLPLLAARVNEYFILSTGLFSSGNHFTVTYYGDRYWPLAIYKRLIVNLFCFSLCRVAACQTHLNKALNLITNALIINLRGLSAGGGGRFVL